MCSLMQKEDMSLDRYEVDSTFPKGPKADLQTLVPAVSCVLPAEN